MKHASYAGTVQAGFNPAVIPGRAEGASPESRKAENPDASGFRARRFAASRNDSGGSDARLQFVGTRLISLASFTVDVISLWKNVVNSSTPIGLGSTPS